jgi:microcystin degradation protein MlrC
MQDVARDGQRAAHHRVAVVGYAHEVNVFADPVGSSSGVDDATLDGGLASSWSAGPVLEQLRARRGDSVEIVELPVWEFGASGPLDGDDFRTVLADVDARLARHLADEGPLDAVVVLGHGAGRSTDDDDTDATFFEMLRRRVGDEVPIVVVLDFHANLSARMCDAVDVIVGYRTNPHVDVVDCSREAAEHVHRLLGDGDGSAPRPRIVWAPIPVLLSQIAQLTTPGEPLHEVMAHARRVEVPPIHNVSVFGGFSLGDGPSCGMSVSVSVDEGHEHLAEAAVRALADHVWDLRDRYRMRTTPLADAVPVAAAAGRGERRPVLLADVADNPGGGAPGNSTFVLRALLDAGVTGVVMGMHCDRAVVDAAWEAGLGARLQVIFNAGGTRPLAPELAVVATVTSLQAAPLVPTRGVYAGSRRYSGRCVGLDLDGIGIAVSSYPVQCADDSTLHHVGLRPEHARVVVVKSRGHFRAGFDHLFSDDQIVEVGAPGVAPVDLDAVTWQHVPRPIWPLDAVEWSTPEPRHAERSRHGARR